MYVSCVLILVTNKYQRQDTPLSLAVKSKAPVRVLAKLIKYGGELTVKDGDGVIVHDLIIANPNLNYGYQLIRSLIALNSPRVISRLRRRALIGIIPLEVMSQITDFLF